MEDERRELQEISAAELTSDRDKDCDRSETPTDKVFTFIYIF